MPGVNREFKDRLFRFVFGNEEYKEFALSLYNAINGSSYTDASDLEFTTIRDAVYMGMKNDVSFLVSDYMNIYEQQSTFNPNMPLRFLIYAGLLYSRYANDNDINLYSDSLQSIPAPRCVCLYNGEDRKTEECFSFKLSDAFRNNEKGDIEVSVTCYNINYDTDKKLLQDCKPLNELAWFVEEARKNTRAGDELEDAINKALNDMPEDFLIRKLLMSNKAEVVSMCITEYDEAKTFALYGAEREAKGEAKGRAEGEIKGRAEGTIKTLLRMIKRGLLTEEEAAADANMTAAEFRKLVAQFG